ncbi:hypothetical protein Mal48_44670 [Thalassoglobus polymorphus]|uniref:Uncharacterized protein n=1 Tax=Thalassoglobus polymorphus TaxID=2527994 RepID=A0A517QU72_9PLAN|nr:hypothetical protein Mal48_44670 [Thalassoglobus polymorphus]
MYDRFNGGPTAEFTDQVHKVWRHAQTISSAIPGRRSVRQEDMLLAWADSVMPRCDCRDKLESVLLPHYANSVWTRLDDEVCDVTPEIHLADSFSVSLADANRFANQPKKVGIEWVVPNLFYNSPIILNLITASSLDPDRLLVSVVDILHRDKRTIIGVYRRRLKLPGWESHGNKIARENY